VPSLREPVPGAAQPNLNVRKSLDTTIRSGVGRRRRWSDEDKGRIVAESYAPGAVVSKVARRQEIMRSALSISLPGARLRGTGSWRWRRTRRPCSYRS
jgi:hypothetical protein